MEYFISYTTNKHPEKRTFGYYGTCLSKGIEVLETYLNRKGEELIDIEVEKYKLNTHRMEIKHV